MYRKYRDGELPDVSITLSDILKPLQALCLRDRRIGSQVFQSFFVSIYSSLYKKGTPAAFELHEALHSMVSTASSVSVSNSNFVSSIFAASLSVIEVVSKDSSSTLVKTPVHRINAEVVSNLDIASKNLYSGIRLLEEQLFTDKRVGSCDTKKGYLELVRLYSILKEQDVIIGISAKVSSSVETQRALDFESEGRFEDAVLVYNNIIENAMNEGLDMDKFSTDFQFWNSRSLDCQYQLLNWEDLQENIQKLVENTIEVECLGMTFDIALIKHKASRDNFLQKYLSCITHGEFSSTVRESFWVSFVSLDEQYRSEKNWIESKCSPDLALLRARFGDWARSRYFVEHSFDQFLDDWVSISSSATSAKRNLLQNLQRYPF
jgi:hypothetical protein